MYGAAPLKQTSVDFFNSIGIPLFNLYGMSENTGSHVQHALDKYSLTTSGFTTPGAETMIYKPDENGEGEICMRGRHVMIGYLNNEEKTIETID
jgi:long-chain-fatty-acid--CoA ligase ACSBG